MVRILLALLVLGLAASCSPAPATPSVDALATTVAAAARDLLTQTAAAASPTPLPTETPLPLPTASPTLDATVTPAHANPLVLSFTGCYIGPGPTYTLERNVAKGKRVELLGVGSEPGWYIIRNPYFHRPCWIAAADIKIDPGVNTDALPPMTPGVPPQGQ